MIYSYEDDEIIKVAYEIPDLQVSDLQRDGPLYLLNKGNSHKPNYIQSQSKYKSFYRIRAAVQYFLYVHRKFQKVIKGQALEIWKEETFMETLKKDDFDLEEKTQNFCRALMQFWKRKQRKSLFHWKASVTKWRIARKVARVLQNLEVEKTDLVKQIEGVKKEIKVVEEKFKNCSQARADLGTRKASSTEWLLKLRRENTLLTHKLDQTGKIFTSYLHQIQTLLH